MDVLRQIIGRERPLDQFHLTLRRAAVEIPGVKSYGACLVTCSDELQGLTRNSFEREIATPLISDMANSRNRVFSVSNIAGRFEPGTISLVDDHFTRKATGDAKLIVLEIAAHVGRTRQDDLHHYGHMWRFGRKSTCCGALTALLQPPEVATAIGHPWLRDLGTSFGAVRLEALRGMEESTRLVAAAIVHAALQAELAVAETLENPPASPTDVLVIAGATVNQQWADGFLPVAYHHLHSSGGQVRIVAGYSLRTTPEALRIDVAGARIEVEGGKAMEAAAKVPRGAALSLAEPQADDIAAGHGEIADALAALSPEHREEFERRLESVRRQVDSIRHDPVAWRTYARPILKGLVRGLGVVQPELGVAAFLVEGGEKLFARHKLKQILDSGPSSLEGRRVLSDIEAELHQLNHEDAQQVLDILLSKKT